MRLTLLACICSYLLSLSNLPAQVGEPKSPAISREVISDIVKTIPSPLELSFLIKDLEIAYDKSLLTPAINTTTEFRQALHLGMYGTDLGYANIYEQTHDALACLQSIKNEANKLGISKFFDFNTIKKFASTRGNLDTLLLVTTNNLEKINDHLAEKDKSVLTVLILTGSWVESLRITCAVYEKYPDKLLKNRIGEGKIILEQLLVLLSFYEQQDEDIQKLIQELDNLYKIYKNVKITYTNEEPATKEGNDGNLITEGGPKAEIIIENETFKAIHQSINNIHQYINQEKSTNSRVKTYIYKEKPEKKAKPTKGAKFITIDSKKIPIKYLYGTWELEKINGKLYKSEVSNTITFLKDKTFKQIRGEQKREGTWDIATNKNQIIIEAAGMKLETMDIISLTQDTLIVQDYMNKITLKKVKP